MRNIFFKISFNLLVVLIRSKLYWSYLKKYLQTIHGFFHQIEVLAMLSQEPSANLFRNLLLRVPVFFDNVYNLLHLYVGAVIISLLQLSFNVINTSL